MLHDMFPIQDMASGPIEEVPIVQQPIEGPAEDPNEDTLQFMKLLKDANQPCYEGCYFEFVMVILHEREFYLGWACLMEAPYLHDFCITMKQHPFIWSVVMLVDDIEDVTITNDGATILKML
nr:hypothetical protein CFP56_29414 [Quercus suber]